LAKLLDVNFEHLETLYVISVVDPFEGVLLATGMLAAWIHGCIGLHHWLGLKPWYRRWLWLIAALAVLIPALSIAGTISATLDVIARDLANPAWMPERFERIGATAEIGDILNRWTNATLLVLLVCTALPFVARFVRAWLDKLSARPRIHLTDGRAIAVHSGATVLETLREHGVAIASVCGGRARCTTCRVNLFLGAEKQTAPEEQEAKALGKFGVDLSGSKTIRLACRLKPTSDVTLAPVFSPDVTMGEARRSGGLEGQETLVSCMFIDLRGSTKLGESRLPYDVLFLLNQFFAEMTEAIAESRGHYAQFNGDGLMALYGLGEDTSPAEGARDALRGARRMV
ncbi:MAG: adenylate/guanylate cyclase domain-containing protein, partial [Rhodospirillaceae bacterium]